MIWTIIIGDLNHHSRDLNHHDLGLNHHDRGDEHRLVDFNGVEEAALVERTPTFRISRFWIRIWDFEIRVWGLGFWNVWMLES